jgi:peptide/nickel transport system substrate-binding protein
MFKSFFLKFREGLWDYPYTIHSFFRKYSPKSYIVLYIVLAIILTFILYQNNFFNLGLLNSNTYTEGIIATTISYNPYSGSNMTVENDINQLVFNKLFEVQSNGNVKGVLAQSYIKENKGTKYIVYLKHNILFQNGKKLTASDVIYSFNFQKTNFPSSMLSNIEVKKLSKFSIEFILQQIDVTFFEDIGFNVVPYGANYLAHTSNIIGTGPYIITSISEDEINFKRFNNYFMGKPHFQYFKIQIFKNESGILKALKYDQIDGAYVQYISKNQISSNINIYQSQMPYSYTALFFNLENLTNTNFRYAMEYSISRNTIVKKYLHTNAVPVYGPISKTSWAYYNSKSILHFHYNPILAQHYLQTSSTSLSQNNLIVYYDNVPKSIITYLKNSWSNIGINIEFVKESKDSINKIIKSGKYDAVLTNIKGSVDPNNFSLWYSKSYKNISHLSSSTIDRFLLIGINSINRKTRKLAYQLFEQNLLSLAPAVFLYSRNFIYLSNKDITGLNFNNIAYPHQRYQSVEDWKI